MTDTTTLEIDTKPVTTDFQVDSGNNLGTQPNQLPAIPSTHANKDAPAPAPTWSEQVSALRDDFVQGKDSTAIFTLVNTEMRKYFAANNQNPTDIDDLCQEVQIKLLLWQRKIIQQRKDGIDIKAPDNFPGFIRGIAHNVLVDKYRRHKATFVESDLNQPGDNKSFFEQLPDTTTPIDDQVTQEVERLNNLSKLRQIQPFLSTRQQTMLKLIQQGLSSQEIAEEIGLNPRTNDKAMFDLRKKLRALLTESEKK